MAIISLLRPTFNHRFPVLAFQPACVARRPRSWPSVSLHWPWPAGLVAIGS